MPTPRVWVVRAGSGSEIIDDVENKAVVALGFSGMGDCTGLRTREEFRERYRDWQQAATPTQIGGQAGQVYRFYREMTKGDLTLTPDTNAREYLVGEIVGECKHRPDLISEAYPHVRAVKWRGRFSRDAMSEKFRASAGNISTVFTVEGFNAEIERLLAGTPVTEPGASEEGEEPYDFAKDTKAKADELIADLLAQIAWDDFERLVAGVLRAMGFRAKLTGPGPDGGSDIIAHPDAFGFEEPRIRVEVKHQKGAVDAPQVRSFRATLGPTDKGLYVSTGGFTNKAMAEPEKAGGPLTLMDRDGFVELLLENYANLEPEFQAMVPLTKVYLPASR